MQGGMKRKGAAMRRNKAKELVMVDDSVPFFVEVPPKWYRNECDLFF
jgi:hypothetical protein